MENATARVGDHTALMAALLDAGVRTVILTDDIITPVTIEIGGGRLVEVDGQGSRCIQRAASSPDRTLLRVAAGAQVTLKNIAIRGEAGGGPLILNYGWLNLSEGLTLENNANETLCGGGVLNLGRLLIQDATIRNNGGRVGGGVFNASGYISLHNGCRIEENRAIRGGGLANRYGYVDTDAGSSGGPEIRTVSHNRARQVGGLLNDGGWVRLERSVRFADNEADLGGALANTGGGLMRLSNPSVVGRSASSGAREAGGVWNQGARLDFSRGSVQKCLTSGDGAGLLNDGGLAALHPGAKLLNNQAANGGGAANINGGRLSLGGPVMYNVAAGWGGGVYNREADLVLDDQADIDGNQAGQGGGVANMAGARGIMVGGLISGNSSQKAGGGVYSAGRFEQRGGQVRNNAAAEGAKDIFVV